MHFIKEKILLMSSVSILAAAGQNYSESSQLSYLLKNLFNGYDKSLSPRLLKGQDAEAVEVSVNIYIISMFSLSEIDMEYSLSMFLRERWTDERLAFNDTLNLTKLELDPTLFDALWVPDLFIKTEKFSSFHEVTVPNKMFHIYPNGTVQYSARVTGSFYCVMNLIKYPFDTQRCKLEFESYGQTTENLRFHWSETPLQMARNIKFPQFDLVNTNIYSCENTYFENTFPCVGVRFDLQRNYAYYVIQIYVPSILIVILSWVNFWLDCTSVPGRVSLALLTVLTMTTQSAGARSNLPRVSYVKAIDVWMAGCLAFVFLGLLEFAYVNVQSRVFSRRMSVVMHTCLETNGEIQNGKFERITQPDIDSVNCSCFPCNNLKGLEKARVVDKISRVVFPLTFLMFNIVYWLYYFLLTPDVDQDSLVC